MQRDWLPDLLAHFQASLDGKGEAWIDCPKCGKPAKSHHCSISARGYFCFACGFKGRSLFYLARMVGIADTEPVPTRLVQPRPEKPRKEPAPTWTAQARVFASHPEVMQRWQAYKPLPADVIVDRGLGVGVLPVGKHTDGAWRPCLHERLTVPLISGGVVVGFRARADDCDCNRWLSPGGSRLHLYNGARLLSARSRRLARDLEVCDTVGEWTAAGRELVIGENPIDADLIEELWQMPAVGTMGVSNWREVWTHLIVACAPKHVIVCFDNDLAGNGGGVHRDQLLAEYAASHDRPWTGHARGPQLVDELKRAGLSAHLYDWRDAAPKTDIGDVIKATTQIVAKEM